MFRRHVGVGRSLRVVVGAFTFTLGLISCGGGENSTSGPTTPSTPSAPTVSSITVTAPAASAKPGDSSQFTATAVMSNNSAQTVTNQATWQSSAAGVATVSSTGFVTAVTAGEVDIRATFQSISGTAHVTVTVPPPSTFNVCGTVKEQGTTIGLSDATVIAKGTAFTANSAPGGRYCLNNVPAARYTLRATRNGYEAAELDVNLTGNITADISMRQSTASPAPSPTPSPTPPSSCCKVCTTGKACGDSCIQKTDTCHITGGCACNGLTGIVAETAPLDYTPVPLPVPAQAVTRKQ